MVFKGHLLEKAQNDLIKYTEQYKTEAKCGKVSITVELNFFKGGITGQKTIIEDTAK